MPLFRKRKEQFLGSVRLVQYDGSNVVKVYFAKGQEPILVSAQLEAGQVRRIVFEAGHTLEKDEAFKGGTK